MPDYDQLISLVRRHIEGECRGQGVLERGRSNAALAKWLREHDAREEVQAIPPHLIATNLEDAKIITLAYGEAFLIPKSVRAVEAESRQARKEAEE